MIDLDRLVAMRNNAQMSKAGCLSLEEARVWKDAADKYIDQLVADAPALLEALTLARKRLERIAKKHLNYCDECGATNVALLGHRDGCLDFQLAALFLFYGSDDC